MADMIHHILRNIAVLFAVALLVATAALAKHPAPPAGVERTPAWNSETSDLLPDASIIYGKLPNGLEYAIRSNKHPKNQVLIRMALDFGSAAEADDEQGLAHFIEHMVFNGTTHVPEGEMVKMLERLGLAFGADTNASTGYTQTQYKLDLPKSDTALIERALFLMRETASEVTFDPGAVDRERGVVLSEQRQRENFGFQSARAANELFYPDSFYSTRYPIGKKEILESAPASRLKALYRKYYRPDRARIIVVGPVDPVAIEREIATKFADWKNPGPPLGKIDNCSFGTRRAAEARIFMHPEINEGLNIQQIVPDMKRPDTFSRALLELKMQIAGSIISERISRRSRKEDIPYLGSSPSFSIGFCDKYARVGMQIAGKDGSWRELMPLADQLVRQAQIYGFSEQEIDEQLKRLDTAFENAVKSENTRASSQFANELITLEDDIVTDAANRQLLWLQARPFMTAQSINTEFSGWYGQLNEPQIFLTTKEAEGIDGAQLLEAFQQSRAVNVTAPNERSALVFAYDEVGPSGEVVEDNHIADLGIRTIRFANGALLNLKKTDFEDNRVRFSLRIDGGKLLFGKENAPLSTLMSSTYAAGGLEAHDADDIRSIMAGTTVNRSFSVGNDYFGNYGAVAPKDLELQLKLLAAYILHPGYRDEALREYRKPLPELYARIGATPASASSIAIAEIMSDNDPRFSLAPIDKMLSLNFEDLKSVLGNALTSNQIEVGLVGDFNEDEAIASFARTIGALPQRKYEPGEYSMARSTSWSNATGIHIVPHRGEANQLGWNRTWTTTDDQDLRLEQTMSLLARIVTIRLLDELREKLGATYGASASSNMSDIYPGRGAFSISTNGDPKDLEQIEAAVGEVVAEIVAGPVDADIFERARKPVLESYADWRANNATWMGVVATAQTKSDRIDRFRQNEEQFKSITADDVWQVAIRFLKDKESYIFRALPAEK